MKIYVFILLILVLFIYFFQITETTYIFNLYPTLYNYLE